MSQSIFSNINPSTTSGTQLATLLNNFKDAYVSGLKGPSRPVSLTAGGAWIDDSQEGSPNFLWSYRVYTGTTDITIFRVNLATSTASISGSDDTFEITRISADSVGPWLKLIKERVASGGQVLVGDTIGEIQLVGTDDTSTENIAARIRAVASDNFTVTENGGYIIFEAVTVGQTSLIEIMRLIDGKVGIGTTTPQTSLHISKSAGNSVVQKNERFADDANPVALVFNKQRIAGTGAAQAGDILLSIESNTVDDTTTENNVGSIGCVATENHTTSAQGTEWYFEIIEDGTITKHTALSLSAFGSKAFRRFEIQALKLSLQDVASAATISELSSSQSIVNITGATDTDIVSIGDGLAKVIVIHNGGTGRITMVHEDAGETANLRFSLPRSKDVVIVPGESAEFFYSTTDSRWKLKSGSGGGGGQLSVQTAETIADGGTVTISADEARQVIKVTASGTTGILSTTPFGAYAAVDPVEVILIGEDNTNTVLLPYNDAAFGCIGDFEGGNIEIGKNLPAKALWYPATQRFYVSRGV